MMMEQKNTRQRALKGKLDIGAILRLETGLHIGASSDFAPIGAVDSPFLRDPMTKQPIIPGSSLKGKIRTLLARSFSTDEYFLNKIDEDSPVLQRLFGSAAQSGAGGLGARLQFSDIRMTEASCQRFAAMELDTSVSFTTSRTRAIWQRISRSSPMASASCRWTTSAGTARAGMAEYCCATSM